MTKAPKDRDEELIDRLLELGATRFDVWNYVSDRADTFANQLWSIGTWLLGIIAATLSLPFATDFVLVDAERGIDVASRVPTIALGTFGALLCVYGHAVLTDIRRHVQRNWERADFVRNGVWNESVWRGAKLRGWWVLTAFGWFAAIGFMGLVTLAAVAP